MGIIEQTMKELQDKGIASADFHLDMTWEEYEQECDNIINESKDESEADKKLAQILRIKEQEKRIGEITLNDLIHMNFTDAKKNISQMTLAKRISVLEELTVYKDGLYAGTGLFGEGTGIPLKEQISAKDFRVLLSRIKHVETIQQWLFGID